MLYIGQKLKVANENGALLNNNFNMNIHCILYSAYQFKCRVVPAQVGGSAA